MQRESNHPAHILDINGKFSSSSFIPICFFGEKGIGSYVAGFDLPVCNIFQPKILHGQLCHETDLQKLKDSNNESLLKQLERGFALVIDYNEERQFDNFNEVSLESVKNVSSFIDENVVSVYLDTIGTLPFFQDTDLIFSFCRSGQVIWRRFI